MRRNTLCACDGLFHAFSTLLLLWGAFRLWRGRENWSLPYRTAIIAAILIGAGAFNLYDGVIQHAILHLHIVNELVCSSPARMHASFGHRLFFTK